MLQQRILEGASLGPLDYLQRLSYMKKTVALTAIEQCTGVIKTEVKEATSDTSDRTNTGRLQYERTE